MQGYLLVFFGAGLGGALRHAVNVAAVRLSLTSFPYGTLTVNVSGSLAMGLLAGYFAHQFDPGQSWRLFLTTGILGGFTTFSTFSLEAALLYQRGEPGAALLYVLTSVAVSIAALFLGLFVARQLA